VNRLDVALLALLALFAVRGFLRGFLRESFGLIGLVAGALAAARFGDTAAEWLRHHAAVPPEVELLAGWLAVGLAVWLVAVILGRVAEGMARALYLAGLNRVAGVVIGSAKGAALLAIGLLLAERHSPGIRQQIAASRIGRPLVELAREAIETTRRVGPAPAGGHA
jgi:membrane protein required for colicin V production